MHIWGDILMACIAILIIMATNDHCTATSERCCTCNIDQCMLAVISSNASSSNAVARGVSANKCPLNPETATLTAVGGLPYCSVPTPQICQLATALQSCSRTPTGARPELRCMPASLVNEIKYVGGLRRLAAGTNPGARGHVQSHRQQTPQRDTHVPAVQNNTRMANVLSYSYLVPHIWL
jgi:hypothetical protein